MSHTVSTRTSGDGTSTYTTYAYVSWLHTQGVIGMTATVPLARNLASQSHGIMEDRSVSGGHGGIIGTLSIVAFNIAHCLLS